ncbi:MAG: TRL-like family protein [Candidatus Omnitrophica bacterium]|nr:TRL-like family protein [Candidatus Omnitrophota bacterium]
MKKKLAYLLLVPVLFLVVGCATPIPSGAFYTEVKFPGGVGDGSTPYTKVGKATSNSYFGLVATGDSSITAAVQNGNIQKIKFIDYTSKNILGIYGEYTTYVYGD